LHILTLGFAPEDKDLQQNAPTFSSTLSVGHLCARVGRADTVGQAPTEVAARPRDSRELLRPDSPAAAPPDINFHFATMLIGGAAAAPKKNPGLRRWPKSGISGFYTRI